MLRGVRKKDWAPEHADLEALTDHLFYEVQVTFFLADRLAKPTGSRDLSHRDAEVEALALHIRQLTDFFWGERRRTREDQFAFAADFFPKGEWERLRPRRPAVLDKPLGIPAVRLRYDREWTHPADRVWDAVTQAFALRAVVERFEDAVDDSHFAPGYVSGMRICASLAA